MKKIRIAFFADVLIENYDGAIRTMYQIIDRIDKKRFEVLFFCGKGPRYISGFRVIQIPNIGIPFNKSYSMALPFLVKGQLIKELNQFKPDIIHIATPSVLGHFALNYGKQNTKPVSTIYHTHFESYVKYYLRNFKDIIPLMKNAIVKSMCNFYNQCDRIFVPTSQMKSDLLHHGIISDNMMLWPRGINKEVFTPKKKSSLFIQKITKNKKYNILFASRLVWEKNLETLNEIYKMAEFANLPYNFIIIGDGVAREELQKKMPNAFFMGKLNHEELSKYYANADIFLFPSVSEAYGSVVVEAMASGLPCVIGNGGGSAGFINHGYNGFLCMPNNPHDYLLKICRILSDKNVYSKFRINGINSVKNLSWDKLVENLFLTWEEMCQPVEYMVAS